MEKPSEVYHYPSREDIESFKEAFQQQIDRRFTSEKEVLDCQFGERDKRLHTELAERDKAVSVLAAGLRENIDRGDDALREHIRNQIDQIKAALISAGELEIARVNSVINQITSVHREIDIEAQATKEAVRKAETATEKRFESVNEFRAQMADQSALFISRREVEAVANAQAEKITAITDRLNRSEGRGAGMSQIWGFIIGGVGMMVGLIAIFAWVSSLSPKVERNSDFRQQTSPQLQTEHP